MYLTFQPPHKPFFLLSIMDLIAQGSIAENFIEPSLDTRSNYNFSIPNNISKNF